MFDPYNVELVHTDYKHTPDYKPQREKMYLMTCTPNIDSNQSDK